MRWSLRSRKPEAVAAVGHVGHWEGRLAETGRALDATELVLRDLAVSITGTETWACGSLRWANRWHSGWTAVSLRLAGGAFIATGSTAFPPAPAAEGQRPWHDRLRTLGILLDNLGLDIADPWILEVSDNFAVTILVPSGADGADRRPVSRGFTAAELAATEVQLPAATEGARR